MVSIGASAYLTLCPDHPAGDTGGIGGPLAVSSRFEGAALCTGYRQEKRCGEPLKLLRKPSLPNAPTGFSLVQASASKR